MLAGVQGRLREAAGKPLQEFSGLDVQRAGEPVDVVEAHVALTALHAANVGSIQSGLVRQVFLTQAELPPRGSNTVAKLGSLRELFGTGGWHPPTFGVW